VSVRKRKVLCAFHADDDLALDIDDAKDWLSQNSVSVKFSRAGTLSGSCGYEARRADYQRYQLQQHSKA
jgi:hypothetical protein